MSDISDSHKRYLVWLTGLSGAGKTTLAEALNQVLAPSIILDGDVLRQGLNRDLGFAAEDRIEVGRRTGEVAKLLLTAGFHVIVSSISPYCQIREQVRQSVGVDPFIEVYVECPLEICQQRDPKGLYKKVQAGEIKQFTGIHQAYEEPLAPQAICPTHLKSVDECIEIILAAIPGHNKEG
ncbi:adenylyl-sulfate kinase [Paenibacillus sp. N1-5-1-14]|uniref:adenylyl-sulfate kinase n=1 Tax=Paenibacillus radicibacter TaxID=2972488 RepID=UPI002158D128|nr:adenylyl-sulfate kinase [Paenibacillus radicibacter]MCR8644683.1 adenylyl-sulfate kinase [Paenibacillus radicibacter]